MTFATGALLLSSAATAFADGAVKVECQGDCNKITLRQACDMYSPGTHPVALSCDDTQIQGQGSGTVQGCGDGDTCSVFGSYALGDKLGDYCRDGAGMDAIVYCR